MTGHSHNSHPRVPGSYDPGRRDPGLAALSDEEFLGEYRSIDEQGLDVHDRLGVELLHRCRGLLALARAYDLSYRRDVDLAGGHPNVILLQLVSESATTADLAQAYRAVWQWIVYRDDTALRARPAMALSEILRRADIARGTWDGYVSRGHVPPRIGHDWHTGEPVWDRTAVEFWMSARRPGRRTDLHTPHTAPARTPSGDSGQ
ncbi:hypothetical protein [Nocardia sp. NRRL S-836]|uniref:hypothetical protein n=1 Tax=Nocardia sp. NRRL S-836 TaxID=1519492 RepID=UPI000A45B285|nr:hypothetical protein [Nocardia sp. NRRL S-836]